MIFNNINQSNNRLIDLLILLKIIIKNERLLQLLLILKMKDCWSTLETLIAGAAESSVDRMRPSPTSGFVFPSAVSKF